MDSIINAISSIAAVVAAIVGICGNRQSQKQFKENMEYQKKATNYNLLNDRLEISKKIIRGKTNSDEIIDEIEKNVDWTYEKFKLLFSPKVINEYNKMIEKNNEIDDLVNKQKGIKRELFSIDFSSKESKIDATNAWGDLIKAENMYKEASEEEKENALMHYRTISNAISQTYKTDDYAEIAFEIEKFEKEYKEQRQMFIHSIEDEITESIK